MSRIMWLGLPRATPLGELIAFAVSETSNAFANVSYEDLQIVHGGQTDLRWEDYAELAVSLREAERLSEAYYGLERRVQRRPALLQAIAQHVVTTGETLQHASRASLSKKMQTQAMP